MDEIRDRFQTGRRDMIEAFVNLSTLARWAGVDEDAITDAHGLFFDGSDAVRAAFRVAVLLAEVRGPGAAGS